MKSESKAMRNTSAQDALGKITALLNAAQFLTSTQEEKELMLELIGAAEDVATRALEGCK